MEKTVPNPYLKQRNIGYVLNTELSPENQKIVTDLEQQLSDKFHQAVYIPKPESLHITLMDWLAPLINYGENKDNLFKEIFEEYDHTLNKILAKVNPIEVHFREIGVSPEAIFIRGYDKGEYQNIRDAFTSHVTLLPNTKRPPKIIHSTIARFLEEVDLATVRKFAEKQNISFSQTIDNFRLVRSTDNTMERLKIIKRYHLK